MNRRSFQQPGRGRNVYPSADKPGSAMDSDCVCPKCGHVVKHTRAIPCNTTKCPKCNTTMTKQ